MGRAFGNSRMIYSQDEITHTQQLQQAMNDVLDIALAHQDAGEIEQAQLIYREIIDIQPKHAEANHHLGLIEANQKGALIALPRLEVAVLAKPENEQYWISYIDALMASGFTDSAADALELGGQYGLRPEATRVLAAKIVKNLEFR
jgi:protein O-GlcNAc transferase